MKSNVKIVQPPGGNVNGLLSDFKWSQVEGETLQLSYSFSGTGSEFWTDEYDYYGDPNPVTNPALRNLTNPEQAIISAALTEIETWMNIQFIEVDDSLFSDLRFGISDLGGDAGFAVQPYSRYELDGIDFAADIESYLLSGDIWLDQFHANVESDESFFRSTVIHELGHALGLSHPHDNDFYIERGAPVGDALILKGGELDQYRYTTMSYNAVAVDDEDNLLTFYRENTTFSQLDIQALQFLYGASVDTGDDLYTIGDVNLEDSALDGVTYDRVHQHENMYVGIGDGGGGNTLFIDLDAIDVVINLQPGSWSNTGGGAVLSTDPQPFDNLWLAESADIDQLILGAGNDTVYDAGEDHLISLGAGNDSFFYFGGNDVVTSGSGTDSADFGDNSISRYQFSTGDTGQVYVKELTSGALLTLIDVEQLSFADRELGTDDILVDIQQANESLIADDSVPLYQSDINAATGGTIAADEAQVYRTYFGALNRAPDQGGYEWWLEQKQSGVFDLVEIAARFIDSPEFRSLVDEDASGDISDTEFLDHVYNGVFGREPDAEGYAWWLDQLETGERSQGDAFAGMTQSDEFVLITADVVSDFWYWMG
jgi:serralysin